MLTNHVYIKRLSQETPYVYASVVTRVWQMLVKIRKRMTNTSTTERAERLQRNAQCMHTVNKLTSQENRVVNTGLPVIIFSPLQCRMPQPATEADTRRDTIVALSLWCKLNDFRFILRPSVAANVPPSSHPIATQ